MKTLEEIQDMWSADAEIDITQLVRETLGVPSLHAKYLNILTSYKLLLRKQYSDFHKLRNQQSRYYCGELSKTELDSLGVQQYLYAKPLKAKLEELLNSDEILVKKMDRIEYINTVVFQLDQILKSIHTRTWTIKNCIELRKFENGV
jgi:hypothetical protein